MKIIVLMAGGDGAFAEQPYPKNLVEIDGLPLAERVLGSLASLFETGWDPICMIRGEENAQWHTADVLRLLSPRAQVVEVPSQTGGAACTALLAIEHIDPEEPLLVYNGDQVLEAPMRPIVEGFAERQLDGGIVVFDGVHPRWSYVKIDDEGHVVEAAEKRPISRHATAGTYWFASGQLFVESSMRMIAKDAHVGGAFYVCPAYNEMILSQRRIGISEIPRDQYVSLATPQGVANYEETLHARRSAGAAR